MKTALVFLGLLVAPLAAFSPELVRIEPRGGQRGTEVEVQFIGKRLQDTAEIVLYDPGIAISEITKSEAEAVVAKLAIAPDAPLGEHSLRVRTADGLTELRSFWVGQFPTVLEAEPNETFDTAQRVELNTTIQGVARNEDDDYYVCTLKKGDRLSVEVEAMRLGRVFFDAYVAIVGPNQFELASCDDAPLLRNDAFVSIIAPEDGDYRILVREAAYEGTDACQYRVHIGTFPRPTAVFPTGGKPGESVEFTFLGDPGGPITQTITLPPAADPMFPIFPVIDGISAPSPHWISVSPLESIRESENNHAAATATPMPPIPSAAHGVIAEDGANDWFKFAAKKGQNLTMRVLARSHRSPLDSVLSIHDPKGKHLVTNDDQGSPDSILNWPCPEDGEYFLRIRDQLSRTGPDFTYRIEVTERAPLLAATLPTIERVNTQKWKTFSVPRGNRYAAVVNITRENLACAAAFETSGLPPGVTMHCAPISKAITTFPVVFEAAADAPVGGALVPFSIRSTEEGAAVSGSLIDTIHHIDINNQGPYHSVRLDRIATAVVNEAPFKIEVVPPPVPLVKNGSLGLIVRAVRSEGYAEPITLRFLWSPPGVSGPVTISLPGDQSEIAYELNANNDAAIAEWQVCVLAEAATPQGTVLVSSALTPLRVAEPYLAMTLDLAATEQGLNTAMVAKLEVPHAFEGEATAELMGLPHGATCPPQKFTADKTELTFPVAIAADATVGKHNGVFCRVTVPENGASILHQTAHKSTLRIDAPPPAPVAKNESAEAAAPAPPPEPTAKPLSRLEQLRQRAN